MSDRARILRLVEEIAATARVTGYCALAGCANIAGAMPTSRRCRTTT